MGYYDDHEGNKGVKRRQRSSGIAGFVGAVIGAVLVLGVVTLLPFDGSITQPGEEEAAENSDSSTDTETQAVSVDVTTDITEAVEQVSDAVVGVFNIGEASFWGPVPEEGDQGDGIEQGTGSGVIYKVEGDQAYVVTNEHVIHGSSELEVSLNEGQRVPAELVGSDIWTDLAVLTIPAENVETVADFGDSEALSVGEPAIAIGNPLGPRFARTVTQGIISATDRSVPVDLNMDGTIDWNAEVLQTDAAINPGNSGGALINIQGNVIGINSMKISQSQVEGIGFAIPTSVALPVIQDIEQYGEVRRPELGVATYSLSEIPSYHWQETLNLPEGVTSGAFITNVIQGSAAEEAGLSEYDVIVEMAGQPIEASHDLRMFLYTEAAVGEEIELTFYREGEQMQTTVELSEQEDTL